MDADDFELAETALLAANGELVKALRMLRDECGWTLLKAKTVIERVKIMQGKTP